MNALEQIIIIAMGITVLIGNSPFHHIIWVILSYTVTFGTLGIIWISKNNSAWIGFIYAISICILLALVELSYQLWLRTKNKSVMVTLSLFFWDKSIYLAFPY